VLINAQWTVNNATIVLTSETSVPLKAEEWQCIMIGHGDRPEIKLAVS
jgi:hypothetical protein